MTHAKAKIIFSSHMEASRRRKLTPYEREQLARASAILRRGRRAAMNPRKIRRKNYDPVDIDPTLRAAQLKRRKSYYVRELRKIAKHSGSPYQSTARIILGRPATYWTMNDLEEAHRITRAYKLRGNPGKSTGAKSSKTVVKIYGRVLRVEAQKTGAHQCDAECKKCGHKYFHDFKIPTGVKMLGLSPGQSFKVPPGCWPILLFAQKGK